MEIIQRHFSSLLSTNEWAKENMIDFPKDKITLVTADQQSGGRGRYGRTWVSPANLNLYASFCFFIEGSQEDPLSLTHVLALSLIDLLEEMGLHAQLKWPNDVMINHKKIAGILCETKQLQEKLGIVLGIGLNINMTADLLENVGQPATSIYLEKGGLMDRQEILEKLKMRFQHDLERFLKLGFTPFLPRFRQFIIPTLRDL